MCLNWVGARALLQLQRPPPQEPGDGLGQAITSTFQDAARATRRMIEVDLSKIPSRHESFFILPDLPDGVYSNEKAKRVLGWIPRDPLTDYFTRQTANL
jgi:nucleoside-diphosphate-sugar epimerase